VQPDDSFHVAASGVPRPGRSDWNDTGDAGSGALHNFFNSAECANVPTSNCFRWTAFGATIQPGASGWPKRNVGFDIAPSVAQFRARMIVAADLIAASRASASTRRALP
jgi:hypothetical protein